MNWGLGPTPLHLHAHRPPLHLHLHRHESGAVPHGLEELHRLELEFLRFSGGQAGFLYATFLRGLTYYVFVDRWRTTDLEQAEWHLRSLTDKIRRGELPWAV